MPIPPEDLRIGVASDASWGNSKTVFPWRTIRKITGKRPKTNGFNIISNPDVSSFTQVLLLMDLIYMDFYVDIPLCLTKATP